VNQTRAALKILPSVVGSLLTAISVGSLLTPLRAADREAADPLTDVVAVGRAPGRIVLATQAEPTSQNVWRYRTIPLGTGVAAKRVELSRSGTKLLVELSDETILVVDLTQKVTTIRDPQATSSQHRLPGQVFRVVRDGKLCSVDDMGKLLEGRCRDTDGSEARAENKEPIPNVESLKANLEKGAGGGPYEWSFFRVEPEVALYAPVLQFGPGENVYPADVSIWKALDKTGSGKVQSECETVYAAMGEERYKRCTVYYRSRSYGGSWLLEYWYYYPFDEGHPNQHIHDSEHLFVEVDKLGGTVRSVLASSHGQFAPNNNYSTLLPGAAAVPLPIYAIVEQRKHAMSPDVNRDGKFERGVDVNLYRDKNAFWGVRDLGGFSESFMRPYRPEMTLPREPRHRMALVNHNVHFPGLEVPEERQTCRLAPFPEQAAPLPGLESVAAATQHLNSHSDARKPEDIYKPWVLPFSQWRAGLGIFDRDGLSRQLYIAYVRDIRSMTGRGVGPSGRLALELMWAPVKHRDFFTVGTQTFTERLSNEMYAGLRYERLLTNSQGFYGGVTPHFRRRRLESVNGAPLNAPAEWDYDGVWYRLGYIIELPFRAKGNMAHHVGIVFNPKRGSARFEWRLSFGFLRHRGRDRFGLKASDRNAYQDNGRVE